MRHANGLFLWAAILGLAGCAMGPESRPIAPPPSFDTAAAQQEDRPDFEEPPPHAALALSALSPASGPQIAAALKTGARQEDGCSFKDRFDREELIAYEFDGGRRRIGLDVDSDSGFGGFKFEGVKVSYTLRLQPGKTKAQRCRYNSGFQGLAGSAYNEFYKRKDNTVWREIDRFRDDIEGRWDTLWQ